MSADDIIAFFEALPPEARRDFVLECYGLIAQHAPPAAVMEIRKMVLDGFDSSTPLVRECLEVLDGGIALAEIRNLPIPWNPE